jgi:hypothetical protein
VIRAVFLLFLLGVSFAVPSCPSYPYKDYVTAVSYTPPVKPPDALLQYCDWNPSAICLISNAFNTTEDKGFFIAEFVANDSFDSIWQWNSNVKFGKYPPNASKSSTNIKDAWVSIAYLNPSVYYNGTYRITNSSQPLIKQSFTFVVDTRKLSGDCKDTFRICGYGYSVALQNTSSNITATMSVKSQYMVDRYHLVLHCSLSGCWYSCDYYRTDSIKDSLTVSDSKKINITRFSPTSNYSLVSYYNGLIEAQVNATDSNVLFRVGNSSFYKADYLYRIRNESGPYDILVKEAIPDNKTSAYGLSVLEQNGSSFRILAPYSDNCSLTVSGYFASKTISGCNLPNLSNRPAKPQITPVQPAFFGQLLSIAGLAIVAYILYLISKRLMKNA